MISVIGFLIVLFFVLFIIILIKAITYKNCLMHNKIFYTIKCPKCGDTYEIEQSCLHGDGRIPVSCFKCGYNYKQKNNVINFRQVKYGDTNEDNN